MRHNAVPKRQIKLFKSISKTMSPSTHQKRFNEIIELCFSQKKNVEAKDQRSDSN